MARETKFENQTNIGDWEPIDDAHRAAFGSRGRPKKHASRADKQRAYRERSK